VPKLSRVAILGTPTSPGYALSLKELELAAEALRLKLQHVDMPISPSEIETAFRSASQGRAGALQVLGGAVLSSKRALIAELAVKSRLPAMYYSREFVEAGGLMTYAANLRDLDRRAAVYVDKILKGRTPADLPVEQPMKFEFVVNLQAAKKIGLTVPPNVVVRANRVIR
jgi:putative ABC transport system substrate-binding protein